MGIKDVFKQIRVSLNQSPKDVAEEMKNPSGYEVGIKHPTHPSFVLARDDGCVEASVSTQTNVFLDPVNQQITIRGKSVSIEAENLHLHSAPDGLYLGGYQRFNPEWFSPPGDVSSWLWRTAPLVQNFPEAIFSRTLVGGPPDPSVGQYPVALSDFIHPTPLFLPNEEFLIQSRNIASILSQLASELSI